MHKDKPFGVLAEFETSNELVAAAHKVREAGYNRVDAYTPFPIHGLSDVLSFRDYRVPWAMFIAGCLGGTGGFLMQCYTAAYDYPLNVGGRPFISWPQFIPVTFESTVLLAALTGAIGMFAMNGLPRPYDPVFNAPNFKRASQDRFFLIIEAKDEKYDVPAATKLFNSLGAVDVREVVG